MSMIRLFERPERYFVDQMLDPCCIGSSSRKATPRMEVPINRLNGGPSLIIKVVSITIIASISCWQDRLSLRFGLVYISSLLACTTFFFTCNFELSTDYETLLLLNYIEVPHEVHVQPLDRLLRSRLSRLVLRLNLASQTTWRRTATRITIHHALLRKHLEVI